MKPQHLLVGLLLAASALMATAACIEGTTSACVTGGKPGTRTCESGRFSACRADGGGSTSNDPPPPTGHVCQLDRNGGSGTIVMSFAGMNPALADVVIWNVSMHHNISTGGIPSLAQVAEAATYVARRTTAAGVSPDELIVAFPSAQETYAAPWGVNLHAKVFMDQLAFEFPGHSFEYHQTNNNKDTFQMINDIQDLDTQHTPWGHYCFFHPNNSAVIVGGNWKFRTVQNTGLFDMPPVNGGNEKNFYPACNTEANWFGSFGIQHQVRGVALNIFTAQTDAGNQDNAASQLAWITHRTDQLSQTPNAYQTFIIGDYNRGLSGKPRSDWSSFGAVPLASRFDVITGSGQCPGMNWDISNDFPDTDGVMQIGMRKASQPLILQGFILDSMAGQTGLTARLPIPGVGPAAGHAAQAALFKWRTGGPSSGMYTRFCAAENSTCNLADIPWQGQMIEVAYGAGDSFTYKKMSGSFKCDNSTFGDPAVGLVKACWVNPKKECAAEGSLCEIPAAADGGHQYPVYFGANNKFATMILTPGEKPSTLSCSNDAFGGDPIYGVVKTCYVGAAY